MRRVIGSVYGWMTEQRSSPLEPRDSLGSFISDGNEDAKGTLLGVDALAICERRDHGPKPH